MSEETPTDKAPPEETVAEIVINFLNALNPTIPEAVRRIHE